MSSSLSLVPRPQTHETPAVLRSWWGGGIVASARSSDSVRVLVAAPSGQSDHATREALLAVFTRQSRRNEPLAVVADALDEVVIQLGAKSVCATLLEADGHGFCVLHRGNPAPLLVTGDGDVSALQPRVPGPPLGGGAGGDIEILPAAPNDVVVLSTPGFAGHLSETLLGIPAQPEAMWQALTAKALADPYPGALAMVVGEHTGALPSLGSAATPSSVPVISLRGA
jgi:hypothetical protein